MPSQIDLEALKSKQRLAWSSGNYAVVGTTLQIVGETLAEACDLRWDERVLDVAAGNGNATLAAARRGCKVTSTDYVSALLDMGAQRASAEMLEVQFTEADAEKLPFADGSFDVVISTFGVMFAPDHARAASEMIRVCRPGGRIAMANWTPDGFIGRMFQVLGRHLPPPPGANPPSAWGSKATLEVLFGEDATSIVATPRMFKFRYRSAEHFIDVFRTWYGPVKKAFQALSPEGAMELEADLLRVLNQMNCSSSGVGRRDSLVVPSEYLEIVITRK
ncbi:SAM-dependent methlyltransferase [Pseudoxanthomonas suwonensis]|uniref:SAM-dependent methlyltransferase n=1 Tax=Pseudoxanthomonas suwonensis TaxID=314722 RepID=A0A0E3UPY5_9GAMM|nr:SAM-dependent methlyltransferase [Pseudoxanthomonas suwonensis]